MTRVCHLFYKPKEKSTEVCFVFIIIEVEHNSKKAHLHNVLLLGDKKKGNHIFCDSMDGTGDYYAK